MIARARARAGTAVPRAAVLLSADLLREVLPARYPETEVSACAQRWSSVSPLTPGTKGVLNERHGVHGVAKKGE